ncbi:MULTISPECIES: ATP-binding protein [Pseudoalteromonas]|uniref:ATP-binding protein n=1 Tax=Pseudoalteromonas TaxID=53246 RepID=UPI0015832C9B|nr:MULTISPECIES: ATP-binding protein [Pseudoalteromonas]MDI4654198.1 ATP-binding protein [Pseudoalteromonas shioyasakiensis]NUJ40529.1 response regulator [Pseudoalteromonas sp. 0303]
MKTDKKSNEELQLQIQYALIEKTAQFQQKQMELLSVIKECIFEVDENFSIKYFNNAWKQELGYSDQQVENQHLLHFIYSPDSQIYKNSLELKAGQSISEHVIVTKNDGQSSWYQLTLVKSESSFIGSLFNIEYMMKEQFRLTQKNELAERLSLVAKHTTNLVIIADPQGKIEWVNSSFEVFTGFFLDEIKGKKPKEFLHGPKTSQKTKERMAEHLRNHENFNLDILNYKKSGEPYWVNIDAFFVFEDEKLKNIVAIESDITAKVEADLKVKEIEQNYRLATNFIQEPILKLSEDYSILYSNESWKSQFDNQLSNSFLSYITDEFRSTFIEAINTNDNTSGQFELFLQTNNGYKWYESHFQAFQSEIPPYRKEIAVSLINIDERIRTSKELSRQAQKAEDLAQAKSRFIANISHEIRTPLNAILGSSELLSGTGLNEEQKTFNSLISTSGSALLSILDDVLLFSRNDEHRIELENQVFNIEECISEVFRVVETSVLQKEITLIADICIDCPVLCYGDKPRTRQMLLNIISNAIKFTSEGHIKVLVKHNENKEYIVSVIDTGVGICKERIDTLFQPFVQQDSSITRKYGGSGLGLAICKQICDAMGGTIEIDSIQGQGSTFRLTLPFVPASEEALKANEPFNFYIIGVDGSVSDALYHLLLRMGHNVFVFKNLDEVTHFNKSSDRVIVTEPNQMFSFSDYFKQNLISVPVLLINANETIRNLYESERFVKFVSGPVERNLLEKGQVLFAEEIIDFGIFKDNKRTESDIYAVRGYSGADVLVVEDNPNNRLVIGRYLEKLNCNVHYAHDGVQCLNQMNKNNFKLVLMDIQMPNMDGIEATKRLRNVFASNELPIIALTANVLDGDKERYFEVGMNDYIAKPIQFSKLIEVLDKFLMQSHFVGSRFERMQQVASWVKSTLNS